MDGVLADVLAQPNQLVQPGASLFRYEDTNLRNQFRVAEKQLAVAQAEHSQAVQAGFSDPQRKADAPLKEVEADLRQTELDYAKEMLDQVEVRASKPGLLLYSDKSDWVGRPVTVGERIMEIADPKLRGSLGGGGRYDELIGMFLGQQIPACGFSLGLEPEARAVEQAVEDAVAAGVRTADVAQAERTVVGTREAGTAVLDRL